MVGDKKVSDKIYQDSANVLGSDRLVDLVGLLGYYTIISMTINVFGVQHAELSSPYMQDLENEIEI